MLTEQEHFHMGLLGRGEGVKQLMSLDRCVINGRKPSKNYWRRHFYRKLLEFFWREGITSNFQHYIEQRHRERIKLMNKPKYNSNRKTLYKIKFTMKAHENPKRLVVFTFGFTSFKRYLIVRS